MMVNLEEVFLRLWVKKQKKEKQQQQIFSLFLKRKAAKKIKLIVAPKKKTLCIHSHTQQIYFYQENFCYVLRTKLCVTVTIAINKFTSLKRQAMAA
jgi:hypothetical protein